MDNLTHTAVGLMMARCGLEKTTVRGAGMMMLAANAPDIDAVFWFKRLEYLEYHRSYAHSFAMIPVMALLPLLLVRAKFSWKAYLAAMAGVLSHLLLDWTNPYGIQLLLPFSHERVRLDMTNIFDFWIWVVLLVGVAAPALVRLVSSEIGAKADSKPRRIWAWAVLIALIGYEGLRFASHQRAVGMMATRLYQGAPPQQVIAVPGAFANPFVWKGIVRGNDSTMIVPVDVTREYDPSEGQIYYESPPDAAIEEARRLPDFQVMMRFSQAQFWKAMHVEGGTIVELIDLRFGNPDNPGFATVSAVVH